MMAIPFKLAQRIMRPWWRLTRGLTLGVRGVVFDDRGRVLMVRHGYDHGWHFPGGGVERGETLHEALERELREEANVVIAAPGRLHGVFSNEGILPGDHVVVFIIDAWRQISPKRPGLEIRAAEFFDLDALPDTTSPGTLRRLAEIREGTAPGANW